MTWPNFDFLDEEAKMESEELLRSQYGYVEVCEHGFVKENAYLLCTSCMTNNQKEWWKERCDGVFRGDQFDLVEDMMNESRSRFKEEVLKALEGMEAFSRADMSLRDGELKFENPKSYPEYNQAIQQAINTIKSL